MRPILAEVERPDRADRLASPSTDGEVRCVRVPDDDLRDWLARCWADVSNAGGAVGFVPPTSLADVEPVLGAMLDDVAAERARLGVLEVDGAPVGFGFVVRRTRPIMQHRAVLARVQVHPDRQGQGHGRRLLAGLEAIAARDGIEQVELTYRDGLGLDAFYRRCGYVEIGRVPNALRVTPDDVRDEVMMVRRLTR